MCLIERLAVVINFNGAVIKSIADDTLLNADIKGSVL